MLTSCGNKRLVNSDNVLYMTSFSGEFSKTGGSRGG
jgi:hypothetical protein